MDKVIENNFCNKLYKIVNNAELLLWISNIHHRDQWKLQIHTRAYPHTHTLTHTHTNTHTHTHIHTHTHTCTHSHTHTQTGCYVAYIASGILSEGALELRFGATAQVHETNFVNWCDAWWGHLIRRHKMSFYKFWWSQELNILKECSVALVLFWENRLDAVAESINKRSLVRE